MTFCSPKYRPDNYPYKKYVVPYVNGFSLVNLTDEQLLECKKLAKKRAFAKENSNEIHHKKDGGNEFKRNLTGLKAEMAVETLTGIDIVDRTIGNSKYYDVPDITEYNIGIKAVEYGSYPVIFKSNSYPQIICITSKKDEHTVAVCGLATPQMLNTYQTEELIKSYNLFKKGSKTCFFGFEKLIPLNKGNSEKILLKYGKK